jgi:SHS2 domain-containing protein
MTSEDTHTTNTHSSHCEHFTHEADIGVRGIGSSLAESFELAASAMTAVITEPDRIQALEAVEIECEASDIELLLVNWLNALIYEMAVRHMLFSRFEVKIKGLNLTAMAWGERLDIKGHEPAVEIKGATLTELKVAQEANGLWVAQCVVDV